MKKLFTNPLTYLIIFILVLLIGGLYWFVIRTKMIEGKCYAKIRALPPSLLPEGSLPESDFQYYYGCLEKNKWNIK